MIAAGVVECPACGTRNRVPAGARGRPRCASCHAYLPWVADADDETWADVVEASPLPVLLDLWAPWCGPCRAVSPALERIARARAGSIKLVKVNVDHAPATARRFGVRSIPTLVVLDRGHLLARQIGAAPEHKLAAWLDTVLASASPRPS